MTKKHQDHRSHDFLHCNIESTSEINISILINSRPEPVTMPEARMDFTFLLNRDNPPEPTPSIVKVEERDAFDTVMLGQAPRFSLPVLKTQPEPSYTTLDRTTPRFSLGTSVKKESGTDSPSTIDSNMLDTAEDSKGTGCFPLVKPEPLREYSQSFLRSQFQLLPLEFPNQGLLPRPAQLGQFNTFSTVRTTRTTRTTRTARCNKPEHGFHSCDICWQHHGMSQTFYCCECRQQDVCSKTTYDQNRCPRPAKCQPAASPRQQSAHSTLPSSANQRPFYGHRHLPTLNQPTCLIFRRQSSAARFGTSSPRILVSNKTYNREQVHWIRFMREDLEHTFPEMVLLWQKQWPEQKPASEGSLGSKSNRDNVVPLYDANGTLVIVRGKIVMDTCKKGQLTLAKKKGIPFKFIERHPVEALEYDWVPEEYKEMARKLIIEDSKIPNSNGAIYRKLIQQWNAALLLQDSREIGDSANAQPTVVLVEHRNIGVKNSCLCDNNDDKVSGGHSLDCPARRLLIDMDCSCPDVIKNTTVLHLPDCASRPKDLQ